MFVIKHRFERTFMYYWRLLVSGISNILWSVFTMYLSNHSEEIVHTECQSDKVPLRTTMWLSDFGIFLFTHIISKQDEYGTRFLNMIFCTYTSIQVNCKYNCNENLMIWHFFGCTFWWLQSKRVQKNSFQWIIGETLCSKNSNKSSKVSRVWY